MITDRQQLLMHSGDAETFTAVCREATPALYRQAFAALQDGAAAKSAVKGALLALRKKLCAANGPIDADAFLQSELHAQILRSLVEARLAAGSEDAGKPEESARATENEDTENTDTENTDTANENAESKTPESETPASEPRGKTPLVPSAAMPEEDRPHAPGEKRKQKDAFSALEGTPAYQLENVLPEPIAEESLDEIRYDGSTYRKKKSGYALIIALIMLLTLLLVWLVLAALMRAGVLPEIDLGYTWFNTHVFELFHIAV